MSELDLLQKAIENSEGKTPQEVLDAVLPKGNKIGNYALVDVTYGHCLFLESFNHPLLKGQTGKWSAQDLAVALFTFTRSSETLRDLVKTDKVEDELYKFLDEIPASKHKEYASEVIFHYYRAMNTAVPMESKNSKAQKKTRSGGFWQAFLRFVGNITGSRNTSPMNSH